MEYTEGLNADEFACNSAIDGLANQNGYSVTLTDDMIYLYTKPTSSNQIISVDFFEDSDNGLTFSMLLMNYMMSLTNGLTKMGTVMVTT